MKLVHLNKKNGPAEDPKEDIRIQEKIIKEHPTNEKAYNRLMILYRKQKEYKKELKLINIAIKTFEEIFNKRNPDYSSKVKTLSRSLSKAMGLTDKKGNSLYEKGELAKWKRRKAMVSRLIKKGQ